MSTSIEEMNEQLAVKSQSEKLAHLQKQLEEETQRRRAAEDMVNALAEESAASTMISLQEDASTGAPVSLRASETPTQRPFKALGRSLERAAKEVGKEVQGGAKNIERGVRHTVKKIFGKKK